ncbi:MAG: GntR family transcriptional regulator [Deltaproteobacteria bacterium]|nr:MAG: GntR family transcriptional regulator [Deltaproteobacteria bacterium]
MILRRKIPLYVQIETVLKSQIRMGKIKEGDRLPPEQEISKQFGVSTLTVRQALAALVTEGYLDRKPGRGTIVRKDFGERVVLKLSGDIDELLSIGKETETEVLDVKVVEGHGKAIQALQLDSTTLFCFVEKLRYWKGVPFMVVEEFVPKSLIGNLPDRKRVIESLYFILSQRKGYFFKEAAQTIESSIADQRIAELLQIEMGSPLFYMERTFYEKTGQPILFQITFTRADHFKFSVRLEHSQGEKEKRWTAY